MEKNNIYVCPLVCLVLSPPGACAKRRSLRKRAGRVSTVRHQASFPWSKRIPRHRPKGHSLYTLASNELLREKFLSCVFCDPEGRFKPSSETKKCQFWSQTVHQKRSCDVPCDGADSISMLPLADRKRQRLKVARLYAHGARFLLRKLRMSRRIASFLTLSS